MDVRIGISGWRYGPWKGKFYPSSLSSKDELFFVSKNLNSLEINGSFYSLQSPKNYRNWRDSTSESFIFSVKGSRYITHQKRLKDVKTPLANFFSSGVLELKNKLGPFLWQFPPNMKLDLERFEAFFKLLPKDANAACALAKKHDEKTTGRASMKVDENFKIRHAVEIRNETFLNEDFYKLLTEHNIALVMSDAGDKWPYVEKLTADFVYVRLHGNKKIYESGYSYQALTAWKKKIFQWESEGKDVFVYFDNDVKVYAPFNAMYLLEKSGIQSPRDFDDDDLKTFH